MQYLQFNNPSSVRAASRAGFYGDSAAEASKRKLRESGVFDDADNVVFALQGEQCQTDNNVTYVGVNDLTPKILSLYSMLGSAMVTKSGKFCVPPKYAKGQDLDMTDWQSIAESVMKVDKALLAVEYFDWLATQQAVLGAALLKPNAKQQGTTGYPDNQVIVARVQDSSLAPDLKYQTSRKFRSRAEQETPADARGEAMQGGEVVGLCPATMPYDFNGTTRFSMQATQKVKNILAKWQLMKVTNAAPTTGEGVTCAAQDVENTLEKFIADNIGSVESDGTAKTLFDKIKKAAIVDFRGVMLPWDASQGKLRNPENENVKYFWVPRTKAALPSSIRQRFAEVDTRLIRRVNHKQGVKLAEYADRSRQIREATRDQPSGVSVQFEATQYKLLLKALRNSYSDVNLKLCDLWTGQGARAAAGMLGNMTEEITIATVVSALSGMTDSLKRLVAQNTISRKLTSQEFAALVELRDKCGQTLPQSAKRMPGMSKLIKTVIMPIYAAVYLTDSQKCLVLDADKKETKKETRAATADDNLFGDFRPYSGNRAGMTNCVYSPTLDNWVHKDLAKADASGDPASPYRLRRWWDQFTKKAAERRNRDKIQAKLKWGRTTPTRRGYDQNMMADLSWMNQGDDFTLGLQGGEHDMMGGDYDADDLVY